MAVNEGVNGAGFKMCPDMPFISQDPTTPQNYIIDHQGERDYMNTRTETSYQRQMDLYGYSIFPHSDGGWPGSCYCHPGCERMRHKFSEAFMDEPKNLCCADWAVAEVKFCTDDGQFDLPCGEEMRDMFGTFTYLPTPFEFTSSLPKMITSSWTMHGCAGSCQRTAGCTRFNLKGSSCELLFPDYLGKSVFEAITGDESAAKQSGILTEVCQPFPWADTYTKTTEVLCKFRTPGWTPESLFAAFVERNDMDSDATLNEWKQFVSPTVSKSWIITLKINIPNPNKPDLVLTTFDVVTFVRKGKDDRRRRSDDFDEDFAVDADLIEKLQTALNLPTDVEFIETVSIKESLVKTDGDVQVSKCSADGRCSCTDATEENEEGECVVSCSSNKNEKSIKDTTYDVQEFFNSQSDMSAKRKRKVGHVVRTMGKIMKMKKRRCARITTPISENIAGKKCDFGGFITYSSGNDAMNSLCRAVVQYQNEIHKGCNKNIKRIGRLQKRCEKFTDFNWLLDEEEY